MTDDSWQQAKDLFHEALERLPEERAAFLDSVDGELRSRVTELLAAHEEADDFLAEPGTPEQIGPYRIVNEIGAGGFGTVYQAEQSKPVRRMVALKIVKLGMDTREIIARFEAERQALAMMNHPGIAQVYDAGATEQGRPYFVMELVDGVPITTYCDQAELSTPERLELFLEVCRAIQHAHQKGIIHRDIKPSNVLVTLHDGAPVPKVIDFGIAKAMGARLSEKSFVTKADQVVGTPAYMSPEQAELSVLDVDTRSDVYSLGVLLYELLTGTTPFDWSTLSYPEAMRVIREVDPPRPSTRISTLDDTRVARRRHTTLRTLGRLVRGDLDWIVMKALEKDPARRYETASALAIDIGRHLADEPVEAGPPSASYRVRKFVRRHRRGVVAFAVVFLALIGGLLLAVLGFREASAQRDVAQQKEREVRTEALRARTVMKLVSRAFTAMDPHHARGAGYTVRQLLLAFDSDLGDSLHGQPDVEATMRLLMGRGFLALGFAGDAERHISRALALCRQLYGEEHARTIDVLAAWGWVQHAKNDFAEAMKTHRKVLALRRKTSPDDVVKIARTLSAIADLHRHAGNHKAGIETGEEVLALSRSRGGTGVVPEYLPAIYVDAGRYADALKLYRELLDNVRRVYGEGHPRATKYLQGLAVIHRDRAEFAEAEKLARQGLALTRKFSGPKSASMANSLSTLAIILTRAGNRAEAEPILVEAVSIARAAKSEEDVLRGVLQAQGDLYSDSRRYEDAERCFEECIEIAARLHGAGSPRVADVQAKLGTLYYYTRKLEAAEKILRQSIKVLTDVHGGEHHDVLLNQITLGRVLYRTKRAPEAEQILRLVVDKLRKLHAMDRASLGGALNALAISIRNQGGTPVDQLREAYEIDVDVWGADRALISQFSYGTALMKSGKLAEGERVLRGAYEGEKRVAGPTHSRTLRVLKTLAYCLDEQKKHAAAEPLWVELLAELRKQNAPGALAPTLMLYGTCLAGQKKYAEAEPLLLEAYETNRSGKEQIARLYEAWGKPEKAKEWRGKK